MTKTLQNRHVQLASGLLAVDFAVFSLVNPRQADAVWLIIGFLLLGLTVFTSTRAVAQLMRPESQRARRLTLSASHYIAAAVVIMIGLQSIGQLTPRDIGTLLPLLVLGYGYVAYTKKAAAP